jgi:hypothetical protein
VVLATATTIVPATLIPKETLFSLQRKMVEKNVKKKQWCVRCQPRRSQRRRRSHSIE